jgi:hypothetical protein
MLPRELPSFATSLPVHAGAGRLESLNVKGPAMRVSLRDVDE